jgi:hypothetical protein
MMTVAAVTELALEEEEEEDSLSAVMQKQFQAADSGSNKKNKQKRNIYMSCERQCTQYDSDNTYWRWSR